MAGRGTWTLSKAAEYTPARIHLIINGYSARLLGGASTSPKAIFVAMGDDGLPLTLEEFALRASGRPVDYGTIEVQQSDDCSYTVGGSTHRPGCCTASPTTVIGFCAPIRPPSNQPENTRHATLV